MPLSYSDLRDLQRNERENANLVSLPKDFFTQVSDFTSSKKSSISTNSSISELREYENLTKTIKEIISLRQKKILFRALKSSEHDSTGMTDEEHRLYDRVLECLKEGNLEMDAMLSNGSKSPQESLPATYKKVQFLKDIPAYKGKKLKLYGPFKKGETHSLPHEEVTFLVGAKMAQETE